MATKNSMSLEEYREYQEMQGRKTKYGNRKTEVDGIKFDSHKEARRYCELKALEKIGEISRLERQKEFILQPGFEHKGKKIRAITYICDFHYYDNTPDRRHSSLENRWVVEDVKSRATRAEKTYTIKKKMLLYVYGIEIKEI